MSDLVDEDGIDGPWENAMDEAIADDATRQWKRDLHAMVEKRDERIADMKNQLDDMTDDRDYWREMALEMADEMEDAG